MTIRCALSAESTAQACSRRICTTTRSRRSAEQASPTPPTTSTSLTSCPDSDADYTGNSAASGPNTPTDTAQSVVACCNELSGPNTTQPGDQAFGQDTTPGGGITGAVFISRFIKPGSVSNQPYNHYSWLRSMEDLFGPDPADALS